MTKITRSEILDTAKKYVLKDRADQHGDMESNLTTIAEYWGIHLGMHIAPHDVAVMMTLLKIGRIKSSPENPDHWIDCAGYSACGAELIAEKPEPKVERIKFQGGNT